MKRYAVVVSVDAMVYEDLETLVHLSFFKSRWSRCARVDRVRAIYPSVTYPCHATMATGVYPAKHGVLNNEHLALGKLTGPWLHMRGDVKCKTIFDDAKEKGLTTAAVFWPVSGNDPSIDYLIDEYWPQSEGETTRECFINSGSSPEVMAKIVDPNLPLLENKNRMHPWADMFVMQCACDMIREFTPNLLMIHPANVDAYRHETGVFSEKVTHGLCETNLWLEQLYKAAEDAGIAEQTDFFIVSDHGQMNVCRNIAPNVLFAENGLITVGDKGEFIDYRAFCKSAGMSVQVYLKDPCDKETYDETRALLDKIREEGVYGISRVYTAEEAAEEGLAGDFQFVLETDGYTSFSNRWTRPLCDPLDNKDYRYGRATHGYHPAKGPQPTLIAFGPHIRPGAVLKDALLVDEAPTIAAALGFEMKDIDGRCLREILL